MRNRLGIGIARIVIHPEDRDLQTYADLRRGQARPVERVHRVLHVGEQRMQFRRVELLDRTRALEQARIAHAQNVPNRH